MADFIIPDEFNPAVIIEAKLTKDDGTAPDKVARVQQLRNLSEEAGRSYDVVACCRSGFKARRSDMRRLLQATNGLVFCAGHSATLWATRRRRKTKCRQICRQRAPLVFRCGSRKGCSTSATICN